MASPHGRQVPGGQVTLYAIALSKKSLIIARFPARLALRYRSLVAITSSAVRFSSRFSGSTESSSATATVLLRLSVPLLFKLKVIFQL